MSRYVTHKHGLILGSANIFFCVDRQHELNAPPIELPEGVKDLRDGYGAIVWPTNYSFDSVNSVNVFVKTPAQQLIWGPRRTVDFTVEFEGRPLQRFFSWCELRSWPRQWLEANVGPVYDKWDVRTRANHLGTDCIFFKRRKDALAFVHQVAEMLKGIQIDDD